jgi:hypothetical protein
MKWLTGEEIGPKAKKERHWLDFRDERGSYSGFIKWDGCLELYQFFNEPLKPGELHRTTESHRYACDDGIHICDIDDMIERLQSLKRLAIAHFEPHFGGWPG